MNGEREGGEITVPKSYYYTLTVMIFCVSVSCGPTSTTEMREIEIVQQREKWLTHFLYCLLRMHLYGSK